MAIELEVRRIGKSRPVDSGSYNIGADDDDAITVQGRKMAKGRGVDPSECEVHISGGRRPRRLRLGQ